MISAHLIREARLRAGISQAELGRRVGRAASAIGRWERGLVTPSLETTFELIRAAGFEPSVALARGDQHDLVLIRRALARSPMERLATAVAAANALGAIASVARAHRG
ncbi:hypothetical protein BH24ACT7_BH24ACT7_25120 [soil metagenome]